MFRCQWENLFKPRYDEQTVFLTALTCVFLLLTYEGWRWEITQALQEGGKDAGWLLGLSLIVLMGILLGIYHAFSNQPKGGAEKVIMGVLVMGAHGAAGITCGLEQMSVGWSPAMIFPFWNVLTGAALLYGIGFVTEEAVSDAQSDPRKNMLAAVVLYGVFVLCQWGLRLNWAMTFSVCLSIASLNFWTMFLLKRDGA